MNTSNLGLSSTSTKQLERMIDDAAWLTYPLHLAAGLLKTFVYGFLFIVAIFLWLGIWMATAHDSRAEEIKNFASEQTIYRVNPANNSVTIAKAGYTVDKEDFAKAFNGCLGSGGQLKNPTFWDHNWLAEKSDVFQSAYIGASHNVAALQYAIYRAKHHEQVASFHGVCGYGENVKIAAPVVYIAFLHRTDESITDPANAQYNWFTGICMNDCTDADFSPRNDNIYADVFKPQVTKNQGKALAALESTGSPEFWIATAHLNGIYDQDATFAYYAAMNQVQLARQLGHKMTPQEDFNREFEAAIICCLFFVGFIGLWIARRMHRSNHSS
jgi:uncharacterized membrane protein